MKKIISLILALCFVFGVGAVIPAYAEESTIDMVVTPVSEESNIEVGDQFIVNITLKGYASEEILPYLTFRLSGTFDSSVAELIAPVYTNEVLGILTNKFDNETGSFTFEGYDQTIRGTKGSVVCALLFEAKQSGTFKVSLADNCLLGKAKENAFYNLSLTNAEIEIAENSDNKVVAIITDPEPQTPYDEVIMGHWAEKAIVVMYKLGALENIADETIDPERKITRGEFATMLVKICKLKTTNNSEGFNDVDKDSFMYEHLRILKVLNLACGDGEGNFMPDEYITRQDAFTLIFRTMIRMNKVDADIDAESYVGNFNDRELIAPYAVDAFAGMFRAKLLVDNGPLERYDPETGEVIVVYDCDPTGEVTLAQAAHILNKLAEFNILVSRK